MADFEQGYLENTYLTPFPYMSGQAGDCLGMQVEMKIVSGDDDPMLGVQTEMQIDTTVTVGAQVEFIVLTDNKLGMQLELKAQGNTPVGTQIQMQVAEALSQVGIEVLFGKLLHVIHPKYLNSDPYLTDSYLAARICALQGTQIEMQIDTTNNLGTQVEMKIDTPDDDPMLGVQTELKIEDFTNNVGMQVEFLQITSVGTEVTAVLYNVDRLRILCEFPSRGTAALGGVNWTSQQALEPGDFDASNVNTDQFEERTQTDGLPGLWELRCDTGEANTTVDTVAILEHNFTVGATVTMQASNDSGFGSIIWSKVLTTEVDNMYFILPVADFPLDPARYYRFLISDGSNPDGHLRVGVILFGSGLIMGKKETFDLPVRFGLRHFKDTVETEGFTNVSSDRATRKALGLTFTNMDFFGPQYDLLRDFYKSAKTDTKCLIIPRPTRPSALSVFAKLEAMPDEAHNAIGDESGEHFVDLSLDWDETL